MRGENRGTYGALPCLNKPQKSGIYFMSVLQKNFKALIFIVFVLPTISVAAQDADALFQNGEWVAAADAYAEKTEAEPDNALAWFRFAASARQAGRYDDAETALVRAEALQFSPVRIGLERARLCVLADDTVGAIEELKTIASSGFTAVNVIVDDPLLARLQGNPGYDNLVSTMTRQAFPCEDDPAFAEFDFWVGLWDVRDRAGTLQGSNVIERSERGCVLVESWSGAGGGTGTSINYLDRTSGEWTQVWNSAGGVQIHIRGGMTEDGMLLAGTIHYVANGTTAPFRGLWTPLPDGRVRQFFEQSADDGQSWTPWFEGFYTRKSAE